MIVYHIRLQKPYEPQHAETHTGAAVHPDSLWPGEGLCIARAHFPLLSLPLLLSDPELDELPLLLLLLPLPSLLELLGEAALRLGGDGLSCRARFVRLSGSGCLRMGRAGERASRLSGRLLRSASLTDDRSPLRPSLTSPPLLPAYLEVHIPV